MSYSVKVNTAGSWANLVSGVPLSRLESAKAACEALALAHGGAISFKVLDASGEPVETYSSKPRQGEPHGWYKPACRNPVQAGLDRTTSGAIGQP